MEAEAPAHILAGGGFIVKAATCFSAVLLGWREIICGAAVRCWPRFVRSCRKKSLKTAALALHGVWPRIKVLDALAVGQMIQELTRLAEREPVLQSRIHVTGA
jgi:hypothetical protein